MPANGPFSDGKDGGSFRRLFEECLRQARLNPRSLHHQLLRDTGHDIPEKTIASWRRPHSTTGRLVVPTEPTVAVLARWLSARDGVSVTEEELLAAWHSDKAAQAARRDARRAPSTSGPSGGPVALPTGAVTFLSARPAPGGTPAEQFAAIVTAHGGAAVSAVRNELLAAFDGPAGAVAAAAAVRREGVALAIHTGPVALTATGYAGLAVHQVGRMSSAAHAGQVVISETSAALLGPEHPGSAGLVDLGEVRLRDLSEPQRLLELVDPEGDGGFPPLKSLDTRPHNLPLQLTTFIGRVAEIEQLRGALRAGRLCTLTGAGGSGKTRLALQLAAEVIEEFGDGVWVVDLTSAPEPRLVAQTVSGALGVRQGGTGTYAARKAGKRGRPATERLTEHLRHRHVLIVLDNCEHMVEPCAGLVEALLRTCPDVRILCTSRERLGVAGELEYRVPPLAVPPFGKVHSEQETVAYESVRLFLDRAAHRRPELRLTTGDIEAVGEICRRVDGSALAIELAAARVRLLSPSQILDLLDDRLSLLSAGSRTAPARHQTLRAMVDWSHDDLSPGQKTLLRRLSVFVGGFDLGAAQHVCSGDALDRSEILDLLGTLVDKSLVETEQHAGVTRCRLLETIRSYGAEKLARCGEQEAFEARHQDWYLARAEEAEAGLTGADQLRWLDVLEADHDNLRAALARGGDGPGAERPLRLAAALGHFWLLRGFLTEGRQHLEQTLARAEPAPTTLRAKALGVAGHLAMFDSDMETAACRSEEALDLSVRLGYRAGEAWALRTLGRVASGRERFDEARHLQDRALAITRELSDAWGTGFLLTNVGNLALLAGRFEDAAAAYEESLAVRRGAGDAWGQIWSLFRLGGLRTWQGRFDDARALLVEGLDLAGRLRYGAGSVLTLLALGERAHLVGDQVAAEAHYVEAHARACDLGDQTGISLSVVGLANVAVASGDLAAARDWLGEEEMERSTSTRSTHAAWLRAEARVDRTCGDAARAFERHREALALRRGLADVRGMTESLEDLGVLHVAAGSADRAAPLLGAAGASRARMGAPVPPLYREEVEAARGHLPTTPAPSLEDAVAAELALR